MWILLVFSSSYLPNPMISVIHIWIYVLISDNREIKYSNVLVFLMLRAYHFWTCYVKILLGSSFYRGVGVSVQNFVLNISLTAFGLLL